MTAAIDWLELCRGCVADIEGVLEALPTRDEREPVLERARAGTTRRRSTLRRSRGRGAARNERRGLRARLGGARRAAVRCRRPAPGRRRSGGRSVNAKRGIPFFALSVAVANGPTMEDVVFGYVYDFGSREEWIAERGRGALLDGRPLGGPGAEARDRDPLLRGHDDGVHRRERTARWPGSQSGCV